MNHKIDVWTSRETSKKFYQGTAMEEIAENRTLSKNHRLSLINSYIENAFCGKEEFSCERFKSQEDIPEELQDDFIFLEVIKISFEVIE